MKATTEFDEIAVFGARGHTVAILAGLEEQWRGRVRVRVMIDDIDNGFDHAELGVPVVSSEARLRDWAHLPVLLTPGSPRLRARVLDRLRQEGATLATVCHPGQMHVARQTSYGAGCLLAPHTRIGPNVSIGEGAQVLALLLGHDVEVGAFSTLGYHSHVYGHVIIGREVIIAPNAVISNGTRGRPVRIGDGAVIGVGAVVTGDVPQGARMIGNPAVPLRDWIRLRRLLQGRAVPGSR